nr:conserved uncharacterized protein [uncultured bacterium]
MVQLAGLKHLRHGLAGGCRMKEWSNLNARSYTRHLRDAMEIPGRKLPGGTSMVANLSFNKKIVLFLTWLLPLLAGSLPCALHADEIVILFDQSGSIGKYDPKLGSKAWLITFLQTFNEPHRIVVAGFDEQVTEHIDIMTDSRPDMTELARAVDAISVTGKVTDIDAAFRYLLDRGKYESVKFALIVTDGEPEIWDGKLGYLSSAVRSDPRYADLNALYDQRVEKGWKPDRLFASLGKRFQDRNIELIQSSLPLLEVAFGGRIIVWDVSGQSKYLNDWAQMAKAQYLSIPISDNTDPVRRLREALEALQVKASEIFAEPLPEDHHVRVEKVLSAVLGGQVDRLDSTPPSPPTPKAPMIEPTPAPSQSPTPSIAAQVDASELLPVWQGASLIVAGISIVVVTLAWRSHRSRLRAPARETSAAAITGILAAHGFPDSTLEMALAKSAYLLGNILAGDAAGVSGDRTTFSLPVRQGEVDVHWTTLDGVAGMGSGIEISLFVIHFEADKLLTCRIDRIVFPRDDVVCRVKRADVVHQSGNRHIAVLREFENGADDWVLWFRQLARLEGMIQQSRHGDQ